jgi:TetR/AcrR family transcriptional regulator of autoinduction and epiphytic fitness
VALENYRRSLSETKRAAILRAGRDHFLANGYSGAAVAEIARDADVSTATLYKYFNSKEELFASVVRDAYGIRDGEYANLPQDVSVVDFITNILHRYLDAQFNHDINALLRTVIAEVPKAPDLARDMYDKLITSRYRELEAIVERLIADGKLKPHSAHYGVRLIAGAVKDHFVWPALFDSKYQLPANMDVILRKIVEDYVALYGTSK